jgi:sensor histidine kinase regulating citrate/malate metabolism
VLALAGFCRKFSFKEVPRGSATESEVGEGWDERETVGDVLDYATVPVEVHGGRIEIESQQGKGSTFRITLPATQT